MRTTFGIMALTTMLSLPACNTDKQTDELVEAKMNAEKATELAKEVTALKTLSETLRTENQELKLELATLRASQASQKKLAAVTPNPKKAAGKATGADKPTAAETTELKDQLTGGGSFK